MYYKLTGKKKAPYTVILDSGMGCPSVYWESVQNALSNSCDRLGSMPGLRTSSIIAYELLISNLVILVGHSFGGANMQLFASRYRNMVAGLVLIDSSHPDMLKRAVPTPMDYRLKLAESMILTRLLTLSGLVCVQLKQMIPKILPNLSNSSEHIVLN